MKFERLSVIGLGYIGLPTAAVFASHKIRVLGVDVNQHAVDTINQGKIHIVEPDLDTKVHEAVEAGYLSAATQPEEADAFIVAVPTPFKKQTSDNEVHQPDLTFIESASKTIAAVLKPGNLVILESTSPVGATEKMAEWLAIERPDLTFPQTHGEDSDIRIAHCPERVLPGHIMRELIENDRVVGGMTDKCSEYAVALYKIFVKGECITTTSRTAEMAKLTENSFRDVNIAFANELSMICDELHIDVWELIALANRHPRVNILQPGAGVGGHCIAIDPWFIVSQSPELARLIKTAREVNDSKPVWVLKKVRLAMDKILSENLSTDESDITIACLGISFKANIDDLRESPALNIVQHLSENTRAKLMVVEPNVKELPKGLTKVHLRSLEEAIKEADILLILVDHREFLNLSRQQSCQVVIDTKGIF